MIPALQPGTFKASCSKKTINPSWSYAITSDFGAQQELAAGGATAYWYNVVQYATYQFDDQWNGGLRFEWFDDIDGVIISPTAGPGTYYALTCGVNYQRSANVLIRPEIRWDSFDADAGVPPGPFGQRRSGLWNRFLRVFSFNRVGNAPRFCRRDKRGPMGTRLNDK